MNPLSLLLKKHDRYPIGNTKQHNVSHLFFVDDLKLYAGNIQKMVKILETVTMSSHDRPLVYQTVHTRALKEKTQNRK